MLGTGELLLRVRDFHQGQQIDRIRIITESIRVECSDRVDMDQKRSDLRNHCIVFLKFIKRTKHLVLFVKGDRARSFSKGPLQNPCVPCVYASEKDWT